MEKFKRDTRFSLSENHNPKEFIKDSKSAFLFSQFDRGNTSYGDLNAIMGGIFGPGELDLILKNLLQTGCIQVIKSIKNHIAFPRNEEYDTVRGKTAELSEDNDIPLSLKLELLYLYYRGLNSNHYRILNIPENATRETVEKAFHGLSHTFSAENIGTVAVGSFGDKIEVARRLIQRASILLYPEKRKSYDIFLHGCKQKEKTAAKTSIKAREHYSSALYWASRNEKSKAHKEILLAITFDPDNELFLEMRAQLEGSAGRKESNQDLMSQLRATTSGDMKTIDNLLNEIIRTKEHSGSSFCSWLTS